MNSPSIILASIALSSAAAVVVCLALDPVAKTPPVDLASVAELQRTVAELRTANTALERRLEALAMVPASATVPANDRVAASAVTNEQIAAAVEAYFKHAGSKDAVPASAGSAPSFDLETDFGKLVGANYWEGDNAALWKKVFAAGRMDEVIKKFEDIAKANPNDIPSQMNLSKAYMAYLQMDQSKYEYSMKADAVYDKVLALDENHWEARFTKAVSYSFWPDFLGKKKDAISHFEVLVEQQEKQPVQADHAQTYIYLGNLLEQRGDSAKAKEIWKKGARRHPDNQELVKKAGG